MAAFTTTAKGIDVQIKPAGSDSWADIGTLSPGSKFEFTTYDSGVPSSLFFGGTITTKYRRDMHPGTLTLADQRGSEVTITPTGNGGYIIKAPEPVRVNIKMNSAIREHIDRCLGYIKPKPAEPADE